MALAGAVIVLALVVVTAAPLAVAALTDAGLQRRLVDTPSSSGTEVSLRVDAAQLPTAQATVEAAVAEHLGAHTSTPWTTAVGPTLEVAAGGVAAATALASATWLPDHTDLVAGSWPRDPIGATTPAALHADAAALLGSGVGDTLVVGRDGADDVTVEIVGTYLPTDADAAVWWDDPVLRDGSRTAADDGTAIAPLVVSPASLAAAETPNVTLRTRALVDPTTVALRQRGAIVRAIEDLRADLADRVGASPTAVDTELPQLLATAAGEVAHTRSAVLMTTLQLVAVAVLTLSLAAGLLVGRRTVETALVRSRGGSSGQLVAASVVEGLALTVPAVLAAPWLAAAAVSVLGRIGPLATLGVPLDPRVTPGTYVVAAGAGLLCLAILVTPVARSARSFAAARAGRGRASGVTSLHRYGLDVVAVVLAMLGVWQLHRYAGGLTPTASGAIGVDPLLVVAPTLAVVAGSLLFLRLLPWVGRLTERIPPRARTVVPAVTTWHLGRRPAQVARGVLLLVLSVAVITLSGAYADTWDVARADRAVAAVGADVSIRPDQRPVAPVPAHLLGGAIADLPGVTGRTPVATGHSSLARGRGVVQVAAVDTRAGVVRFRDDQGPRDVAIDELHAPRSVPSVLLPDGAELTAELSATVRGDRTPGTTGEAHGEDGEVGVALTVRDGDGLVQRLTTWRIPVDGSPHPVDATLADERGGRTVAVTGPVEVLGIELSLSGGSGALTERTVDLELAELAVDDRSVALGEVGWVATVEGTGPATIVDPPRSTDAGAVVSLQAPTGDGAAPARVHLAVDGERSPTEPLSAFATPGLLAATELRVGDVLELRTPGVVVQAQVVDTIGYLPGDPGAAGLLFDLPTLAAHRYLEAGVTTTADAWWLTATDGREQEVVGELRAAPFGAQDAVAAAELRDRSLIDPVGIGLLGVLALALVVAGAAAVVGYGAAAAATAGERTQDVAALRGLGLSRRQLRRWSLSETAIVVGAATVGGIAVGLTVASSILPSIAVANDGTPPVPTPRVVVPWSTISTTVLVAAVVVGAVAVLLERAGRRVPVAATLRAGSDA